MALGEQQRFPEAERAFRKSLDLDPSSADAYNNLGYVLIQQDKLADAETLLRDAVVMHGRLPGNKHSEMARSLENLVKVLQLEGKGAEAKALLEGQTNTAAEKKPELR